MTKTAIVILNWNGELLLPQFLPSVIKHSQGLDNEVIVVDNASEDNSLEVMKKQFPEVRCIAFDKNFGFAGGYNEALKQIEAEYYVLLNSDVEVSAQWLEPMVSYMDKHQDVAACGPKILDHKKKTHFEYAGAAGGYLDKYGFPFCRGRIFSEIEEDQQQYDSINECLWVSGCALFIRSQLYHKHGGLDDFFFAHMEEIDLCWRLKSRGFRIVNIPQSTIYHVGGASLKMGSPRKTYLNFRNNLLMLYKNTPEHQLKKVLKRRKRLDFIAAVKFLLTDGPEHYEAVFQAHDDFEKARPRYKEVRKENLKQCNSQSIKEIYQGSLVYDFYIKQKKYFSAYFKS